MSETTNDLMAAIRARQADREIGPLDGSDAEEASADCAALLAEVERLTRGLATADTIREQETQRAETTYARLVGAHDWATGAERERDEARAELARLRAPATDDAPTEPADPGEEMARALFDVAIRLEGWPYLPASKAGIVGHIAREIAGAALILRCDTELRDFLRGASPRATAPTPTED
jgi:hypothetical protein